MLNHVRMCCCAHHVERQMSNVKCVVHVCVCNLQPITHNAQIIDNPTYIAIFRKDEVHFLHRCLNNISRHLSSHYSLSYSKLPNHHKLVNFLFIKRTNQKTNLTTGCKHFVSNSSVISIDIPVSYYSLYYYSKNKKQILLCSDVCVK